MSLEKPGGEESKFGSDGGNISRCFDNADDAIQTAKNLSNVGMSYHLDLTKNQVSTHIGNASFIKGNLDTPDEALDKK